MRFDRLGIYGLLWVFDNSRLIENITDVPFKRTHTE